MCAKLGAIAMVAACLVACAPEGPTAIVVGSMIPDEECAVSSESVFLLKGSYDVSAGITRACQRSYNMNLLVNSYLIRRGSPQGSPSPARAEPNVLRITEASVALLNVDDTPIAFTDLPNPFSVTTFAIVPPADQGEPGSGIALVEVIPGHYSTQMQALGTRRATLVAEVKLFGETTGAVGVELAEYRFPIQLCNGCMTVCGLSASEAEDLREGQCADNAGADGRFCIEAPPCVAPMP